MATNQAKPGVTHPSEIPPRPAADAPQPRTRAAVSKERLLLMALSSVIKDADAAKPKFTSTAIESARATIKEFNKKFLKPTQDRITAIHLEMQAAVKDPAKINAGTLKELAQELARLQKKLGTTQGQAA